MRTRAGQDNNMAKRHNCSKLNKKSSDKTIYAPLTNKCCSGDLESGSFDKAEPINNMDPQLSVTVTLINETGRQQTDPNVISDKRRLNQRGKSESSSDKEAPEGLQTTDPDGGLTDHLENHDFAWPDLSPDHPYDIPFFASDFQGGIYSNLTSFY